MIKPVCVKCQRFYRPERNGFPVLEGKPRFNGARPGTEEPGAWLPYKLWHTDLWKCHGCGHLLVVGSGPQPISEDWQPDFDDYVAAFHPTLQVNDC